MKLARRPALLVAALLALSFGGPVRAVVPPDGLHTIQHVIVIMQENRSFDSYFGTFPGADGIPMRDGVPQVCVPDPQTGECVKPLKSRIRLRCWR